MPFDAGTILAKMALDISQWEQSARAINESQKKMAGQTKKTGSAFKGMWKQMAVGLGVTTLITSGIRGLMRQVGDTIKRGREFEKEWANVTTMLEVSKEETAKMKSELLKLSPTLGSTTDLAKGMYQVLSASIEPAKAIRFLGEAAKAAKAGVTDTATAVDAITTVINSYGLEAKDATEISDIMFQTVKKGKTTYGELAQSLGTVVPIAATTGVKFKEVAAAVSTMTRMGIPASKATMQLRQVLMSILTPSEEAEELAGKLGISFGASALKAKGLAGWLTELREKTHGDIDAMKTFVPNARALTAVMSLAGIRAEEFTEDLEGMNKVLGNTDRAFRKQMESIDFWIVAIEEAGNKAKLAFFEGLVDPVKAGISTSKELDAQTRDLMGVSNELGKVIGTLGKTQVDELTTKWKHNKMAVQSLRFIYLSLANFINQGQIPTLKNAAKAWGEHYNKLRENERQLKIMGSYFGWAGAVAEQIDLLRERVRWILEDSKSSKESIDRLEEYKTTLQEASGIIAETTTIGESHLVAVQGITLGYDAWGAKIVTISDLIAGLKDNFDQLGQSALPVMRDLGDVVGLAVPKFKAATVKSGKYLEDLSMTAQQSYMAIAMSAAEGFEAILSTLKQWAIAEAVKYIFATIPFPASLILAAVAAGAIGAFYRTITGMEEGGVTVSEGIYHLHPEEVILPISKAPAMIQEITHETIREREAETAPGAQFHIDIKLNIYAQTLDDRTINQAAEKIYAAVDNQARRRGYGIKP